MSRLPNAPLVEVIFEIKWDIKTKDDLLAFQYLHGDLYAAIKENFPVRENIVPPDIPLELIKGATAFRFRTKEKGYPIIQVGPGVLSINTIDKYYFWNDFSALIRDVISKLFEIQPQLKDTRITPALTYLDLLKYDQDIESGIDFINSNLKLNIVDNFMPEGFKPNDVHLKLNYSIDDLLLSLAINNGRKNETDEQGLVLQTKIIGTKTPYSSDSLTKWLGPAHNLSRKTFKSLTEGKLYESFKS